ncbi:MAG: DUF3604 domain-containing protein [Chrysiogenetes bacterium]|nr:DUF3604 domain-containing protein [Chrysiogenetes bacterium]
MKRFQGVMIALVLFTGTFAGGGTPPPPPEPTEPALGECQGYSPTKNAYFGDLHVHTSYSLDAVQFGNENDPWDAYAFAKGDEVHLAPYDDPNRKITISKPLDFAAVTDHSEFMAEASVCFEGGTTAYWSPWCVAVRRGSASDGLLGSMLAFGLSVGGMLPDDGLESNLCRLRPGLCNDRAHDVWQREQQAAKDNYDMSTKCKFTTFVGYEYTGSPRANNWHRNIIFKNDTVPDLPISFLDAPEQELLYDLLDAACNNNPNGCEALAIPHNSNLGGGAMFVPFTEDGTPYDATQAAIRSRVEPLVEMYQHKGASECTFGPGPLGSEDELCGFELLLPEICTGSPDDSPDCKPLCSDLLVQGGGFLGRCIEPSDFVRGALRNGIAEQQRIGANPFKMGFIGSTDTHNSIPGATEEQAFPGHGGSQDATLADRLTDSPLDNLDGGGMGLLDGLAGGVLGLQTKRFSPGGLAVVWAEQNTRGPIFESMQNRETYATSGTRIITRFFGGWNLPANMCGSANMVSQGYSNGVAMGGDLPPRPAGAAPRFSVSALRDQLSAPLQRIQIIKGWTETVNGQVTTREKVFEVAGNPDNGASVDVNSCQLQGSGYASLCEVWEDPEFNPNEAAFYYARVVENPTCRWHRAQCNEAIQSGQLSCDTVDPDSPLANCCNGSLPDTIQERAWTSPIWYTP